MQTKNKKKVILLTGSEVRHNYFRVKIAQDKRFNVICSYCEKDDMSLKKRILSDKDSSLLQIKHAKDREINEKKYFSKYISEINDYSNPIYIDKGDINNEYVISQIEDFAPDILVCYGSSLIKGRLIKKYKRNFLNVHLGLSPYYRGSGTNIFPIINNELHMIGATFMYLDSGIDTGKIIHQIRPDLKEDDSPHTIGNRLIAEMIHCYSNIIANHEYLTDEEQPREKGLLYYRKDFNNLVCEKLYDQLSKGIIKSYLNDYEIKKNNFPYIVKNKGLEISI
tara:strand:+ start:85 stop:924 length:840 start_codon:yes stop_codon:yes gene_type:complete